MPLLPGYAEVVAVELQQSKCWPASRGLLHQLKVGLEDVRSFPAAVAEEAASASVLVPLL